MARKRLIGGCAAFALLATVLAAPQASAQSARAQSAVPTPQQMNPAQLAPTETHARPSDVFTAPEPGPCPLRDSPLSFALKGVTFEGQDGAKGLDGAYAGMIGQTVPVAAICDIRDRASAILFRQGILARVEIPEQRIAADGQLRLQVIEARIAAIHFHGDAGPAEAKVEEYLERLRGLAPFNLNTAQRYLLLAADIPGVQISAAIRPSSQGRGAVDLDVTITRKVVDAAFNVENYGSQSLGPWAALASADFKALTPFGDRTAVVLYSTTGGREQRIGQLIEEIRPGDDGWLLRGSASYAMTRPGGDLATDGLKGHALDLELTGEYPLIRRRRENLNLIGGLAIVDQRTDFGSGGTLFNDKLRIVYLRAEANARGALFGLPVDGGLGLEVRRGLNALGASRTSDAELSRTGGIPDATVERVDAHSTVGFAPWMQLYLGGQYQYATVPLLTYEQVAIGNLTIGRGYDPSSVSGDRGGAGTIEPRFIADLPYNLKATVYGFYDIGYAYFVDTRESATVRSAGGGLRLSTPVGVDVDVFYAQPFDKPSFAATAKPPPRVLFALTYRQ